MKTDTSSAGAKALAKLVKPASAPAKPNNDIQIDLDGLADRLIAMPIEASNYGTVYANGNDIYYIKRSRFDKAASLIYFSLKDKKETVLGQFDDFQISADGKKMLVVKDRNYAVVDIATTPITVRKMSTFQT